MMPNYSWLQVLFWDVRVDKLLKKGNKRMDDAELVWKPMHSVHLLSVAGESGDTGDAAGASVACCSEMCT
jgi:hypothetical protein